MRLILNDGVGKRSGKVWFDFENRWRKKFYGMYFIAIEEPIESTDYLAYSTADRKILAGESKNEVVTKLKELIADMTAMVEKLEE